MLKGRVFGNWWLDKTLQFVIASNGYCALVGEHTVCNKIDGPSVRQLLEATTEAILSHNSLTSASICNAQSPTIEAGELAFDIPEIWPHELSSSQNSCLQITLLSAA